MKVLVTYGLKTTDMNIIVKPHGCNLSCCRPDTTWERENKDFYSPDCINEIWWTPVIFARVCKAGKCVGKKFVERYYDGIGCGVLLYGSTDQTQMAEKPTLMPYIDKSSILPAPLYNPVVMEEEKILEIKIERDGNLDKHTIALKDVKTILDETICRTSELISLRIGDFVAVELTSPDSLCRRTDTETRMTGKFCDNEIFDFKIIM